MNNEIFPLSIFFLGIVVAFMTIPLIIRIAQKYKILATDWNGVNNAKRETPLLGGVAIYISFVAGVFLLLSFFVDPHVVVTKHIIGLLGGGLVLVIGGILDDKYSLSPKQQILWPILAVIIVVVSGIGVSYFTNPFAPEKLLYVNLLQYDLLYFKGIPYRVVFPADVITFVWLIIIMYSTKLQDGLDGLVSGISFVGASFIFLLSYFVFDDVFLALLAALFAGVLLGFLHFNSYPAKIFLGESGSLLTGFILGVLALLSDAKIIVTLLLLAIPIADAIWTVSRRIYNKKPFWKGDEDHLHHKLLKVGYTPRGAALLLYGITASFGVLVMLWQSSFQYYFYGVFFLVILAVFTLFFYTYRKANKNY